MNKIKEILKHKYVLYFIWACLIFFSYFQIDIVGRYIVNKKDFYFRAAHLVPCSLSIAWILLFIIFYMLINKKAGKIIYILTTVFLDLFMFAQMIHLNILGRCFGINDVFSVGEGAEYFGSVFHYISYYTFIIIILSIIFGYFTIKLWPKERLSNRVTFTIIFIMFIFSMFLRTTIVSSLKDVVYNVDTENNNDIEKIYDNFSNNTSSIQAAGIYEFIFRSIYLNISTSNDLTKEEVDEITTYLNNRNITKDNEYSGILKDKNVIYIMLESVDPLYVNDDVMPFLNKMKKEGWNFTNRYTPMYGVGATFNTEFASITGTYSATNSKGAYFYSKNNYKYSLANLFKEDGYITNSFHMNKSSFYDRNVMHNAMGFIKYNSFLDYTNDTYLYLDSKIMDYDNLYNDIAPNDKKFFSFIITFSGHMPYTEGTARCEEHLEERFKDKDYESRCFKTLLYDTDVFLERLVGKLEEENKLNDTVLVLFNDHIAYSYSGRIKDGGKENYDLNKGFYLIYGGGLESKSIDVINNTIDMVPTMANLFGLSNYNPNNYLGVDVFNKNMKHIAYFADYSWLDENHYSRNISSKDYKKNKAYYDEINNYVEKQINTNNKIVMGDYFKY